MNKLVENHHVVEALWSAVNTSSGSLVNVGPLVQKLLKTGAWRKRRIPQLGRDVEFDDFRKFLKTAPLEGCGWKDPDAVRKLIKDDPAALDAWDRAVQRSPGGDHQSKLYNIQDAFELAPTGTSAQAAIRRLRKDRPDIHKRVLAGELTAHAGMVEAGFRKKLTPFQQIAKLLPKLTDDECRQLEAKLKAMRG